MFRWFSWSFLFYKWKRDFVLHVLLYCSLVPCIYREDYKHYLSRPDLKQELVTQWQKDFNSIPDDMREDEETKAELHLRMDVRRTSNIIQCKYSYTDNEIKA